MRQPSDFPSIRLLSLDRGFRLPSIFEDATRIEISKEVDKKIPFGYSGLASGVLEKVKDLPEVKKIVDQVERVLSVKGSVVCISGGGTGSAVAVHELICNRLKWMKSKVPTHLSLQVLLSVKC